MRGLTGTKFNNTAKVGESVDLTPARMHREGSAAPTEEQLTFDVLGPSLFDVTFVVVDLETTGGKPGLNAITEFGAVKVRGGDVIDEFTTLVNPGVVIPPQITVLTGITNSMVALAPDISEVMPNFLRFIGDDPDLVLVAHNANFDIGHLRGACAELGLEFPKRKIVDTVRLARKTFTRDETPNYKLATLARLCGAEVQPTHRALDDARATVDVLHAILSRLGGIGVTHLADLMTATDAVPQHRRAKAHLADGLPRGAGVYKFIGPGGEVLYVGTSVNVYKRVRQYFTAAEKRKRIAEMVDLAVALEALPTATTLEASVVEVRLIDELDPPYNRRSRRTQTRPWIMLTDEPHPRLKVARKIKRSDMDRALGPFTSNRQARNAVELLESVSGLRSCSQRLAKEPDGHAACHLFELGSCSAPCLTGAAQGTELSQVKHALAGRVRAIAESSLAKIKALAKTQRYEQAAGERDRLYCLVGGAKNFEEFFSLVGNQRIIAANLVGQRWEVAIFDYGVLRVSATTRDGEAPEELANFLDLTHEVLEEPEFASQHVSHDEVRIVSQWMFRDSVRILKATQPELLVRSLHGGYSICLPKR
ncbi:DNA polymerase-3 subunit epsilon [Trueperella bonasi]|uniref:DNA polymerase-3 subunit epsilon n=1 Tax=Trueperella bonasi TaxID=312286 RepID=A0ABT9NJU5_9ACTO|nr:DEDD exonuclease domain-containing protein [Trueperella bonasi]MDP9807108.1 DNA polymerase-3 subunit epsilon [Trueperella bonasi]